MDILELENLGQLSQGLTQETTELSTVNSEPTSRTSTASTSSVETSTDRSSTLPRKEKARLQKISSRMILVSVVLLTFLGGFIIGVLFQPRVALPHIHLLSNFVAGKR